MKLKIGYRAISAEEIGDHALQRLLTIYPAGKFYNTFSCTIDMNDPKATEIQRVLDHVNVKPRSRFRRKIPGEYTLLYVREYEQNDLESAELLVPFAPESDGLHREWPEPPEMMYGRIKEGSKIVSGTAQGMFAVRDDIKQQLEASGLEGAVFAPLKICESAFASESYWVLSSNRVLPPLAPGTRLRTVEDKPFAGDYAKGCILDEGLWSPPEFHFERSSIEITLPFDLAITRERFGNAELVCYPRLIASKRFYDICQTLKLKKMTWRPVRIDPG